MLSDVNELATLLSQASFSIGGNSNPDVPAGIYHGIIVAIEYGNNTVQNESSKRFGQTYTKVTLKVETDDHYLFNVSDGRHRTGLPIEESIAETKELAKDYIEGRHISFNVIKDGNFTNANLVKFAEK